MQNTRCRKKGAVRTHFVNCGEFSRCNFIFSASSFHSFNFVTGSLVLCNCRNEGRWRLHYDYLGRITELEYLSLKSMCIVGNVVCGDNV